MNKKEKITKIIKILKRKLIGKLSHLASEPREPFRILIGTILSQRTKDRNTAIATNKLFSKFKTPKQMAEAKVSEIEKLIKKSGFYKTKARRIKEVSRIIVKKYKGRVPKSKEELIELPGVGPKTAGCVLVYGMNIDAIPVDTHVHRISNRLGIVKTKTPEQTEKKLEKIVPKKYWKYVNELFVIYGQNVCRPIKPRCEICSIKNYCDYYKKLRRVGNRSVGNVLIDKSEEV